MILLREKIDEVDTTGQSVRITPCSTETMAPYLNPLLMAAVVWVCLSAGASAESTVEQQLQQLKDNYVEMQKLLAEKDRRLDALERENVKSKKTLEAQVTRLEAKTRRMEIEAIEQKSQLTALQQQNALRSGTRAEIATRQATTPIIPRSCANVQCNGNTVSGLYPIMGTSSVEMVFCDFTKATTDANFQRRIGYVDVKTAPVYFYVQKNNSFATAYVPIPFEVARVNIGGAMNLTSGTFTAPRAGTYFFSYTGDARFVGPSTNIMAVLVEMLLNGQRVGTARVTESNTSGSVHSQMSMQSTLTLKAGDRIWLQIGFMTAGGVAYVYDNPNADQRFNHFTGWLVEENFAGLF